GRGRMLRGAGPDARRRARPRVRGRPRDHGHPPPPRSRALTRYEYKVLLTDIAKVVEKSFEEELNGLGREGWKLEATVHRERHGYSHELTLVFSRPLAA